jgi:hypothetical protein
MSLRHRGCGERHKSVDVEVGEDSVVVRCSRPPGPDTWRRLYAVLAILGLGSDTGDAEPPASLIRKYLDLSASASLDCDQ